MNRFIGAGLVPLLALTIPACSDRQLASAAEQHRAWVCSHQTSVTLAARLAIDNAASIKDENARKAAVAVATADLAIVASCAS